MGVPLPGPDTVDLHPPDAAEVDVITRAFLSAASPSGGPTETQRLLISATVPAMTGHPARLEQPGITAQEFAEAMARRDGAFRSRMVQNMVLLALVLRPLPREVADRVATFADELGVEEDMLATTARFAEGSLGLAAFDFERSGYSSTWSPDRASVLHTAVAPAGPWTADPADPQLSDLWRSLEDLPDGTLGKLVTDMYRARGFAYPGEAGSAPPLLAQHDWVHVLAGYGTTVESELEVFAFIARANDDPRAFSLLAMVVSLFETGYLRTGAGLFEYSQGHLSREGVATRVADALRRGAVCPGSTDFLAVDWFGLADLPLVEARRRFGVPAKSAPAVARGAVSCWEPGGITPFQVEAGRALARARGRAYDAFGASPSVGDPGS